MRDTSELKSKMDDMVGIEIMKKEIKEKMEALQKENAGLQNE